MLWSEVPYLGPPDDNWTRGSIECRGLVLHIAEGSFDGTIAWMRNSASDVSSHFVIARDGRIVQMLDTAQTAWTQVAGNGHWVSVENEGFSTQGFTAEQAEANAQLYAWLLRSHGVPAQLADSPSGSGLGWHGMGGVAWGNHPGCPGAVNVALRPAILDRAITINNGGSPLSGGDMAYRVRSGAADFSIYLCPGGLASSGKIACFAIYGSEYDGLPLIQLPDGVSVPADGKYDVSPEPWPAGGGSGSGPTLAEIRAAVRAELDATKLAKS